MQQGLTGSGFGEGKKVSQHRVSNRWLLDTLQSLQDNDSVLLAFYGPRAVVITLTLTRMNSCN